MVTLYYGRSHCNVVTLYYGCTVIWSHCIVLWPHCWSHLTLVTIFIVAPNILTFLDRHIYGKIAISYLYTYASHITHYLPTGYNPLALATFIHPSLPAPTVIWLISILYFHLSLTCTCISLYNTVPISSLIYTYLTCTYLLFCTCTDVSLSCTCAYISPPFIPKHISPS